MFRRLSLLAPLALFAVFLGAMSAWILVALEKDLFALAGQLIVYPLMWGSMFFANAQRGFGRPSEGGWIIRRAVPVAYASWILAGGIGALVLAVFEAANAMTGRGLSRLLLVIWGAAFALGLRLMVALPWSENKPLPGFMDRGLVGHPHSPPATAEH